MPTKKKAAKKKVSSPAPEQATNGISTEIVCVVDRSGSMSAIADDAIGGFNRFLEDQKKAPGETKTTIVLFDHEYQIMCSGKSIQDVQPFTRETYVPRGSTALLDAVGRTLNEVSARKPQKVIFAILTDGHENSSHEFTNQQIKSMIQTHTDQDKWLFLYLSADPNAFDDGGKIGIGVNQVMQFAGTPQGVHVANMAASFACADYRSSGQMAHGGMQTYSRMAKKRYDTIYH